MNSNPKKNREESANKEVSMKSLFPGYYKPAKDDFDALWSNGIIVLDTNVLLSLYKTPVLARNEIVGVLEKIKNKIWIPYHVALEFQRNRPHVIEDSIKKTTETFEKSKNAINTAIDAIKSLEIEKHSKNLSPKDILNSLEKSLSLIVETETKLSAQHPGISIEDELRAKIDNLIENRIGHPPKSQDELDSLVKDADRRYALMIPPGFKDISKSDEEFYSNGIRYKRKHGDLIIWRQIISYCKDNSIRNITIITNDKKDDWWWIEKGKTLGPHHELCSEIRIEGGVQNFWMYKLEKFMQFASDKLGESISADTLSEIKEANKDTVQSRKTEKTIEDNLNITIEFEHKDILKELTKLHDEYSEVSDLHEKRKNSNSIKYRKDSTLQQLDDLLTQLKLNKIKNAIRTAEEKKSQLELILASNRPIRYDLFSDSQETDET